MAEATRSTVSRAPNSDPAASRDGDFPAVCDVWFAPEPAADAPKHEQEEAVGLLSSDERARMARFRFSADRRLYLAAHVLLRRALSRSAPDIPPADWRFTAGAHGRPEIAAPACHRDLRFNLSHTRGLTGVVTAWGRACGIDLEHLDRRGDSDAVARRVLAPAEQARLTGLPEKARREVFLRYWTVKEAYSKARGLGLALDFDQTAFVLERGAARLVSDPSLDGPIQGWQFRQWYPRPGYLAALALATGGGAPPEVRMHQDPPE